MKRFATIFCLIFLYSSLLQAAVVIDVLESNGNVLATATGSINTAGLPAPGNTGGASSFVSGSSFQPGFVDSRIAVGSASGGLVYRIDDTSSVFSTGGNFLASASNGNWVGVLSGDSFNDSLYINEFYVSDTPISSTSTWLGQTFASMGLIPGTYVFTWGADATADTLTINIGGDPAPTFSVEGTVSGLTALGLVLQINGGDDLDVFTNGNFFFSDTMLDDGSAYAVTVLTNPPGHICTVTGGGNGDGSGTIASANVTDITVTCTDDEIATYTVGGTVSGLTGSVTLQNNGGDDIIKTTNDGFTFTAQAEGSDYAVTVSTQPTGQTCTVTNGSGTNITANITNVTVTCVDDVVVVPPIPATPVPTMSQWALIMLSMLLGLMVFANRKRLF